MNKFLAMLIACGIISVVISLIWIGLEYVLDGAVCMSRADRIVCSMLSVYIMLRKQSKQRTYRK